MRLHFNGGGSNRIESKIRAAGANSGGRIGLGSKIRSWSIDTDNLTETKEKFKKLGCRSFYVYDLLFNKIKV